MDTYQAIYDAVRSRIHGVDVSEAMRDVLRGSFDASFAIESVRQEFLIAAENISEAGRQMQRPFMTLRPKIYMDGNQWCALYGENLQDGVAGFGDSPEHAAQAFDGEWISAIRNEAKK